MSHKEPLFTIPHLIVAISTVAVITLSVLFAINPIEVANKSFDERLAKLAEQDNPKTDCASIASCDFVKYLIEDLREDSCFAPRSFYYKKKYLAEGKVIEVKYCDPKETDWESKNCFVCLK